MKSKIHYIPYSGTNRTEEMEKGYILTYKEIRKKFHDFIFSELEEPHFFEMEEMLPQAFLGHSLFGQSPKWLMCLWDECGAIRRDIQPANAQASKIWKANVKTYQDIVKKQEAEKGRDVYFLSKPNGWSITGNVVILQDWLVDDNGEIVSV